jgi:hypothetical protein
VDEHEVGEDLLVALVQLVEIQGMLPLSGKGKWVAEDTPDLPFDPP